MATLPYRHDLTIGDVAAYAVLERSFVSCVAAALERRGLLDRRMVHVQLTRVGLSLFRDVMQPKFAERLAEAFYGIGQAGRTQFLRTPSSMMHNVYRAASSFPPELNEEMAGPAGRGPRSL